MQTESRSNAKQPSIEIPIRILNYLIDDTLWRAEQAKRNGDTMMFESCIEDIMEVKKILEDQGHTFLYNDELESLK